MSSLYKPSSFRRFIQTILDIGFSRFQRRLRYEIRQRLDRCLPSRISIFLAGAHGKHPAWRIDFVPVLSSQEYLPAPTIYNRRHFTFEFLNQERILRWPINWNDPSWPRLWQFHLHYFDWARDYLDQALISGKWNGQGLALQQLLDSWISSNPPGYGDGWHSYTISLRTRNWINLFRDISSSTPERLRLFGSNYAGCRPIQSTVTKAIIGENLTCPGWVAV